jgi:hypothetical protein
MEYLSYRTKIDLVIDPRLKAQRRNILDEKVTVTGRNLKDISAATAYELVARTLDARTAVRQGKLVLEPALKVRAGGGDAVEVERLPKPKPTKEEEAVRKKMRERVEAAKVIYSAPFELPFPDALDQIGKCHEPRIPFAVDVQAFKLRDPGNWVKAGLTDRKIKLTRPDRATVTKALTALAKQVDGELEYLADVVIIVPAEKKKK